MLGNNGTYPVQQAQSFLCIVSLSTDKFVQHRLRWLVYALTMTIYDRAVAVSFWPTDFRAVEFLLFFFDLIWRSSSTRRCFMMRF